MSSIRAKPVIISGLAAVVLALAAWWFLRGNGGEETTAEPTPVADAEGRLRLDAGQRRALGIRSVEAQATGVIPLVGLPAEAVAPLDASSQVSVPYPAVVTRLWVDEGQQVRRGQPLLRLQSRELIAVQGELARARAEAGAAQQQARRDRQLVSEGLIPRARQEESAARAATASASLGEATALLSQLRRAPGGAPGEFDLLAPRSGRVLRRQASTGQALDALAPVFMIVEGEAVDIRFDVPLALRAQLRPGLAIELPDGARGEVVAVGADTDTLSQTLRVRARSEDASLIAGQQFELTLHLPAPADAVAVPASALVNQDGHGVLYLDDGEALRAVRVEHLGGDADNAVVRGPGLQAGTRVVDSGTSILRTLLPPVE
ncbi:efflux RND transporter periplasmic adaptor subunit [Luteimonas sp. e5]